MNDKEKIISLLNEFANPKKMASFFVDNATPDFLFIRPSGNPIDAKEFEKMISGDLITGVEFWRMQWLGRCRFYLEY